MLKIGLLGGSFNPPHAGHVHLANFARKTLRLDAVWLLPVPQNTLKDTRDMAPFSVRLLMCNALSGEHSWLFSKDDEIDIGTNETLDTVHFMQKKYPHTFVWLMGADSFATVHDWGESSAFFRHIPTAVFARTDTENAAAHASVTAQKTSPHPPQDFIRNPQNGWSFFSMPEHSARATDIRALFGKGEDKQNLRDVSSAVKNIILSENLYQTP